MIFITEVDNRNQQIVRQFLIMSEKTIQRECTLERFLRLLHRYVILGF